MSKHPRAFVDILYKCPVTGKDDKSAAIRTYADNFGAKILAEVACHCGQYHSYDITIERVD